MRHMTITPDTPDPTVSTVLTHDPAVLGSGCDLTIRVDADAIGIHGAAGFTCHPYKLTIRHGSNVLLLDVTDPRVFEVLADATADDCAGDVLVFARPTTCAPGASWTATRATYCPDDDDGYTGPPATGTDHGAAAVKACRGCGIEMLASDPDVCERCDDHDALAVVDACAALAVDTLAVVDAALDAIEPWLAEAEAEARASFDRSSQADAHDPAAVHLVGNLWAVGDDDHRFVTEAEAREYGDYLARQALAHKLDPAVFPPTPDPGFADRLIAELAADGPSCRCGGSVPALDASGVTHYLLGGERFCSRSCRDSAAGFPVPPVVTFERPGQTPPSGPPVDASRADGAAMDDRTRQTLTGTTAPHMTADVTDYDTGRPIPADLTPWVHDPDYPDVDPATGDEAETMEPAEPARSDISSGPSNSVDHL